MQSTLSTFTPDGPKMTGGCRDCHVMHSFGTFQGREVVRCVFLGHGGPVRDLCRYWLPEDLMIFWPPLADNYQTPLKWLIRAGLGGA